MTERFESMDSVYERMQGAARMQYVDQGLLDIRSDEQLAKAREFINNVIELGEVTANQLARRTSIKPAAISAFRNGKWKGALGTLHTTASKLMGAIDQLLKQRERDEQQQDLSSFVPTTRFAESTWGFIQDARTRRLLAAFIAQAGQGKSMIMGAASEEVPGAALITVRQRRSAPKSFLQVWARALGLLETGRAEDLQDRIIDCLFNSDRLMLIDEAHKLQVATLDIIREVWDAAKVPIVLAGTPSFHRTLTTRRVGVVTSELMDQLFSRVGLWGDFTALENPETGDPAPLNSIEDIRRIFSRGKVRLLKDAEDFLCRLANMPGKGALRSCRHLVEMVIAYFPEKAGGISAKDLRAVLRMKVGTREAEHQIGASGGTAVMAAAAVG